MDIVGLTFGSLLILGTLNVAMAAMERRLCGITLRRKMGNVEDLDRGRRAEKARFITVQSQYGGLTLEWDYKNLLKGPTLALILPQGRPAGSATGEGDRNPEYKLGSVQVGRKA
jgi:hypothetical protein